MANPIETAAFMTVGASAQPIDAVAAALAPMPSGRSCSVLGMRVHELNYDGALSVIRRWAGEHSSRYICVANVHMVMESYDDPTFQQIVNRADLVCPDGMPVVWGSHLLGLREQTRVVGPELTFRICAMMAKLGLKVGFYGSTPEIMQRLVENVGTRFPNLDIGYHHSPPFRDLTPEEDAEVIDAINASGTRVLFVGLGCPKQERWMKAHRGKINAVMLGVGWAFEIGAGLSRSAPTWMQQSGLEWFFRLLISPRKVWRRYLKHNPRYLGLMILQLLGLRRFEIAPRSGD